MSNVEVVREALAAAERGDIEAVAKAQYFTDRESALAAAGLTELRQEAT